MPTGLVLALTVVAANELADALAGRAGPAPPAPAAGPSGARRPAPWTVSAPRTARGGHPAHEAPVVDRTAPVPEDAVLAVRDLRVSVDGRARPGHRRLASPSAAARVLGLVGESGCGKTMTARSLLGLLPDGVAVSGGSITLAGHATWSACRRASCGAYPRHARSR